MTFKSFYNNLVDFKRIFYPGSFEPEKYTSDYAAKAQRHAQNDLSKSEIEWTIKHSPPAQKVLDVGCNTGFPLNDVCLSFRAEGTGVDVNPEAIDQAAANFPQFDFQTITESTLPFEEKTFDHVMLHHVLGHVKDPLATLSEIRRILKPQGSLSVITPNAHYKIWQFPVNLLNGFDPDITVLRYYTRDELMTLFQSCGFGIKVLETLGPQPKLFENSSSPSTRLRLLTIAQRA